MDCFQNPVRSAKGAMIIASADKASEREIERERERARERERERE